MSIVGGDEETMSKPAMDEETEKRQLEVIPCFLGGDAFNGSNHCGIPMPQAIMRVVLWLSVQDCLEVSNVRGSLQVL